MVGLLYSILVVVCWHLKNACVTVANSFGGGSVDGAVGGCSE